MRRTEVAGRIDAAGVARAKAMMDEISVPAGTVFVREDAPGFDVFVVIDGTAAVSVAGSPIGYALPGDVVGATGLPGLGTHRATVTAETAMRLLTAETETFLSALGIPEHARAAAKAIARALEPGLRPNDGTA